MLINWAVPLFFANSLIFIIKQILMIVTLLIVGIVLSLWAIFYEPLNYYYFVWRDRIKDWIINKF